MHLGLSLAESLRVELESFQSPYFVTLTLDPKLFEGPEDAVRWIQKHGVISEFVRMLRRKGYLLDDRYFACWEFQANGWPHWHLVFDASFIPFAAICEAWSAAGWAGTDGRKRWGQRPEFGGKGTAPVFGSVRFRIKGRECLGALCHYLTKYVTKMPEGGWPAWLGRSLVHIRRWSTSREFWRNAPPPRPARKVTEWAKLRGKYFDPDEEWVEDEEFLRKIGKVIRTIAQRCDACGDKSVVLEEGVVVGEVEGGGGIGAAGAAAPRLRWRWVGLINGAVWNDPRESSPTFKLLDEVERSSFVVSDVRGCELLRSLAGGGG
jgi:hypothetical protein